LTVERLIGEKFRRWYETVGSAARSMEGHCTGTF